MQTLRLSIANNPFQKLLIYENEMLRPFFCLTIAGQS